MLISQPFLGLLTSNFKLKLLPYVHFIGLIFIGIAFKKVEENLKLKIFTYFGSRLNRVLFWSKNFCFNVNWANVPSKFTFRGDKKLNWKCRNKKFCQKLANFYMKPNQETKINTWAIGKLKLIENFCTMISHIFSKAIPMKI